MAVGRAEEEGGPAQGLQAQRFDPGQGGDGVGPGARRVDDDRRADVADRGANGPIAAGPTDGGGRGAGDQGAASGPQPPEVALEQGIHVEVERAGLVDGDGGGLIADERHDAPGALGVEHLVLGGAAGGVGPEGIGASCGGDPEDAPRRREGHVGEAVGWLDQEGHACERRHLGRRRSR